MLGRAADIEWLSRRARATAGAPQVLALVEGAMGHGKTALLHRVVPEIEPAAILLRGDRLRESEAPLVTARPLIEDVFGTDMEEVVAEHSGAAILRHCRMSLEDAPRPLVIDDAQWIDPASRRLLVAVIPSVPVTVLAYRSGMGPLDLVAAARGAGAVIEHLEVGPLDDDDVERLAAELPATQRRVVVDNAAGSPLFAHTMIGAFRRRPEARTLTGLLDDGGGRTSDALTSVLAAELRDLGRTTRRTLTAIAVLGTARPDHLSALTGPADVQEDLRELRRRGLLTTSSEPVHPLVRHTAYHRADESERATMHRAVARLAETDAFARAEHLAALRGEATADDVEHLLDAAERALDTDPRVVDRWLSGVAHLGIARRDLLWARSQVLLGRPEQAGAVLRSLVTDPWWGPEARILYAQALRMSGKPGEAHEVLTAREAPRRPELLFELAATTSLSDRSGPRRAVLEELLAGPEPYAAAARAYRALGLLNTGDVDDARQDVEAVVTILLDAPAEDLRDVLEAVSAAAWCAYMLDDFRGAISLAERGLRIARRFGRATPQPNLNCALAFALIQVGRLDDADEAAAEALTGAERYRVPDNIAMARVALVLSAFWQNRADLMRSRADELAAAPVPSVPWWRRTVTSTLARTRAMLGEPGAHVLEREPADVMTPLRYADAATVAMFTGDQRQACRLLDEGRELAGRYRLDSQVAFLGVLLSGLIADEDPHRATALLEWAGPVYERLGMPGHGRWAAEQLDRLRERSRGRVVPGLTRREREIAHWVAAGETNQEIADRLVLSRRTVEEHVSNILRKLDVRSRHRVAAALDPGG